jgi:hypothetical protein
MLECKEKYHEENEKMFNRFEREFNKITSINTKKNGICVEGGRNKKYLIPTKEKEEDKISQLKKEILEQKKIVAELESKNKY